MNKSMTKKCIGFIVCFAASLAWGSSVTQAFDGYGGYSGYAFPWFGYGNNGPAAYALGNIPAPPYFALHPPVYYSHPTPRTYGYSPFAMSGDCYRGGRTAAPQVVANPYIQIKPVSPSEKSEKPVKVAAVPQRLANPFYEKPGSEAVLASDQD